MSMRLAPLIPRPDATASAQRKPPRRPFSDSYVVPKLPQPGESTFGDSPSLSRDNWGQVLPPGILPKLEVGAVNDPLEREADAIADRVMRVPASSREVFAGPPPEQTDAEHDGEVDDEDLSEAPSVGGFAGGAALPGSPGFVAQRKCASCEADDEVHRALDDELLARECDTCEDEDELRRACASCDAKENDEIRREPAPTPRVGWGALVGYRLSATNHATRLAQAAEWTPPEPRLQIFASPRERSPFSDRPRHSLRRACAACSVEGDDEIQREPGAGWYGGETSGLFAEQLRSRVRGYGRPLSDHAREFLEPRLGVDLGHLRVHEDAAADSLARRINARAFTLGHDIFFRSGELKPTTHAGMRLLAHEVAHTLQGATPEAPSNRESQGPHEGGKPRAKAPTSEYSRPSALALDITDSLQRTHGQAIQRNESQTEPLTAFDIGADLGDDITKQDEKLQSKVESIRYWTNHFILEYVMPNRREDVPSQLSDNRVPTDLRKQTERASVQFLRMTEYLEKSGSAPAAMLVRWLDTAIETLELLQQCLKYMIRKAKNDERLGDARTDVIESFESTKRKSDSILARARTTRNHKFFQRGAQLDALAQVAVDEANARQDDQLREALIQKELDKITDSAIQAWTSKNDAELEGEILETQMYAQFATDSLQKKMYEAHLVGLQQIRAERAMRGRPTWGEERDELIAIGKDNADRLAKILAARLEANPDDWLTQRMAREVLVSFSGEQETRFRELTRAVFAQLSPSTIRVLSEPHPSPGKETDGQALLGTLTARSDANSFAVRFINETGDPEGAEALQNSLAAMSKTRGAQAVAAAMKAAHNESIDRFLDLPEGRKLLRAMTFALWQDGFEKSYVPHGDKLAKTLASRGASKTVLLPNLTDGQLDVFPDPDGAEGIRVTLGARFRDERIAEETQRNLPARGVYLRLSDRVNFVLGEHDYTMAVPALKLVEFRSRSRSSLLAFLGLLLSERQEEAADFVTQESLMHLRQQRREIDQQLEISIAEAQATLDGPELAEKLADLHNAHQNALQALERRAVALGIGVGALKGAMSVGVGAIEGAGFVTDNLGDLTEGEFSAMLAEKISLAEEQISALVVLGPERAIPALEALKAQLVEDLTSGGSAEQLFKVTSLVVEIEVLLLEMAAGVDFAAAPRAVMRLRKLRKLRKAKGLRTRLSKADLLADPTFKREINRTGRLQSSELGSDELENELAWVFAHSGVAEGKTDAVKVGKFEWQRKSDGRWCRSGTPRVCVTPNEDGSIDSGDGLDLTDAFERAELVDGAEIRRSGSLDPGDHARLARQMADGAGDRPYDSLPEHVKDAEAQFVREGTRKVEHFEGPNGDVYDEVVDLPNGHKYRRKEGNHTWCRFSGDPWCMDPNDPRFKDADKRRFYDFEGNSDLKGNADPEGNADLEENADLETSRTQRGSNNADEIAQANDLATSMLATKYGAAGAEWAVEHLPVTQAEGLLSVLTPKALEAIMDIPSPLAARVIYAVGIDQVNIALGLGSAGKLKGSHLYNIIIELHPQTAKDYLQWAGSNGSRLARVARTGDWVTQANKIVVVGGAAGAKTVILDNNARIAIDELLRGKPFNNLDSNYQQTIRGLRQQLGLPAYSDPVSGAPDLAHIVGNDADLRVTTGIAQETLYGESKNGIASGALKNAKRVDVDRSTSAYADVLKALRGTVDSDAVGGTKGSIDRSAVADALMAKVAPGIIPTLVTSDTDVLVRLAERFAVRPRTFVPQMGQKKIDQLRNTYRTEGWFEIDVLGHVLRVVFD